MVSPTFGAGPTSSLTETPMHCVRSCFALVLALAATATAQAQVSLNSVRVLAKDSEPRPATRSCT